MIDIGGLLSGGASLVQAQIPLRAQIQWSRILDKPTDVELRRKDDFLPVQTVRIEGEDWASDAEDISGFTAARRVTVFGIHGHPSLDDTDIDAWDSFIYNDLVYTVVSVNKNMHGIVQAYCEALG